MQVQGISKIGRHESLRISAKHDETDASQSTGAARKYKLWCSAPPPPPAPTTLRHPTGTEAEPLLGRKAFDIEGSMNLPAF